MNEAISFRHPPVVETVLGIQFKRLPNLTNGHLGAFWGTLRPDWPTVADAPPLDDQEEWFGGRIPWGGLRLKLSQDPSVRLQIRSQQQDRMIQVQNCRLDYNWLRQDGGEYPRYCVVKPEFDRVLASFQGFLEGQGLGPLAAKQWEITYVNHLPRGTVWDSPADWGKVFRSLPGPVGPVEGLVLEALGGTWHFEITPRRGRLHVEIQHGFSGSPEGPEILVMKLTARGPVPESVTPQQGIDAGLNLGHDRIVSAFRELTSPEAQAYWNREP